MTQSPYDNRPDTAFWRSGVVDSSPLEPHGIYTRKWPIEPGDRIATAGSCFAQHIARVMRSEGFAVLDTEPAPNGLPEGERARFGYGLYSARYGNIYTTRQLLQLMREALQGKRPADPAWQRDGRFFDSQRPGVEPEGLSSVAEVLDHRTVHLSAVRRMIEEMDVFIFTLGLTEAWEHRTTGTVFPTAPGTIAGEYDDDTYGLRNLTVGECLEDLRAILALLEDVRGRGCRVLLTVSPVPLTATAEDRHVLQSTTYSKAVLRAAAGQMAAENDAVDYFPSYEIVTNPAARGVFYAANLRSVTQAGVATVMRTFLAEHGTAGAAPTQPNQQAHDEGDGDDLICEEAMLEAFGK